MTAFADRVTLWRRMLRRWAVGPLVVRIMLFAAGLTTGMLATPQTLLLPQGLGVAALAALVVALSPRGPMPSVLMVCSAAGWFASTTFFEQPITLPHLLGLAAGLYLTHTLAALAAVLPYDAVLPPGVVGGWLLRASMILALSAGLGVYAVVAAPKLQTNGYLIASLGGALVVGALLWALVAPVRRR